MPKWLELTLSGCVSKSALNSDSSELLDKDGKMLPLLLLPVFIIILPAYYYYYQHTQLSFVKLSTERTMYSNINIFIDVLTAGCCEDESFTPL